MFPTPPEDWESVEASEYASRFLVEALPAFFTGDSLGHVLFVAAEDREVVPGDYFYEGLGYFIADIDESYLEVLRRVFDPISIFGQRNMSGIVVPEYAWSDISPGEARGNYATEDEARAAAERLVTQGIPVGIVLRPNGYWALAISSS